MKVPQLLSVLLVPVLAAAACNRNDIRATDHDTATATVGDRAADADVRPISITGCLQTGSRGSFIVTGIDEASQRATDARSGEVQAEQRRQASHAYRVEPKDRIDLESLVGKQVSVTGTVEEQADLPLGTTGNARPEEIKTGDLARLEATSVTVVADVCN